MLYFAMRYYPILAYTTMIIFARKVLASKPPEPPQMLSSDRSDLSRPSSAQFSMAQPTASWHPKPTAQLPAPIERLRAEIPC